MAVPEQTPYKEYVGNGVTTNFALEFTCDSKQELKVFINDVEPELSTWSLASGSVSFTSAPALGSKIVLKRATKLERTTNYLSNNNSFRPEAINKDFDRVWYALQDQAYKLGQYDLDYSYAINTSNQALSNAATAQQKADSAYNLADTINTKTRPIERGGTGATTAAGARTNLNVMSSAEVAAAINTATPRASTTTQGLIQIATQAEVNAGANSTKAIVPNNLLGGMKTHLSASGAAPIYACRAWVNFNGTGTVAIRGSGNVSSITDNGVGNYTVNFTAAMQDINYSVVGSGNKDNAESWSVTAVPNNTMTTSFRVLTKNVGVVGADLLSVNLAVFR